MDKAANSIDFRFDPSDHSYWLGSRRLLGVTEIIKKAGLIYEADQTYLERGTVAHQACELLAKGILDFESVDQQILGYVLSFQKLLDHTKWIATATETSLFDPILQYAGTFDLCTEDFLIDLKTGAPAKWHKIQISSYWHLAGEHQKCFCVYLKQDGSLPTLVQYNPREGFKDFVAILNFVNVRSRYANGDLSAAAETD